MGGKGYRPSATASAAHKGETAVSASGQPFLRQRMLWHLRDTLCHNSERIYAPQVLFLTCTRAITEEKMLASGKMVGFVPIKDYDKERDFYEGKLGCEFISLEQYAVVKSNGCLMIRDVN